MTSLIGTVYPSGVIEFLRNHNKWAFRAIEKGMKTKRGRVVLDPGKAPIELTITDKVKSEEQFPWLERVRTLLAAANRVYLRPQDNALRFLQATAEISKHQQLVTLGSQTGVDDFSNEHWRRIKYLYAKRVDGFRFDVRKLISHRVDRNSKTREVDMATRMFFTPEESVAHVMFDATGSGAHVELIDWRGTITEGEQGRFAPVDAHIVFSITQVKRPLTFLQEFRDEFKTYAYEFEGDDLRSAMSKMEKRLKAAQEAAEQDEDDFEVDENLFDD